jgi:cytochrome c oxidase assembly factor CtaG
MAVLYGRGLATAAAPTRPKLFFASLLVAAVALLSPLNEWASQIFFFRVGQHLLLISLFPALFMHSNPLPVLARGLGWQGGWAAETAVPSWLQAITSRSVVWFLFIATVWLWYDPTLHAATLARPWVRPLELASLTLFALAHWWHIAGASPHLHPPLPTLAHIGYTMAGVAPLKIPGLFLLFSLTNSYPAYPGTLFWLWEIDPLTSQQIGGMLVWLLGGTVYSTTALRFLSEWFGVEAGKPERPRHLWDNPETMAAP